MEEEAAAAAAGGGERAGEGEGAAAVAAEVAWEVEVEPPAAATDSGAAAGDGGGGIGISWDIDVSGAGEEEEQQQQQAALGAAPLEPAAAGGSGLAGGEAGAAPEVQRLLADPEYRTQLLDDLHELLAFLTQVRTAAFLAQVGTAGPLYCLTYRLAGRGSRPAEGGPRGGWVKPHCPRSRVHPPSTTPQQSVPRPIPPLACLTLSMSAALLCSVRCPSFALPAALPASARCPAAALLGAGLEELEPAGLQCLRGGAAAQRRPGSQPPICRRRGPGCL